MEIGNLYIGCKQWDLQESTPSKIVRVALILLGLGGIAVAAMSFLSPSILQDMVLYQQILAGSGATLFVALGILCKHTKSPTSSPGCTSSTSSSVTAGGSSGSSSTPHPSSSNSALAFCRSRPQGNSPPEEDFERVPIPATCGSHLPYMKYRKTSPLPPLDGYQNGKYLDLNKHPSRDTLVEDIWHRTVVVLTMEELCSFDIYPASYRLDAVEKRIYVDYRYFWQLQTQAVIVRSKENKKTKNQTKTFQKVSSEALEYAHYQPLPIAGRDSTLTLTPINAEENCIQLLDATRGKALKNTRFNMDRLPKHDFKKTIFGQSTGHDLLAGFPNVHVYNSVNTIAAAAMYIDLAAIFDDPEKITIHDMRAILETKEFYIPYTIQDASVSS